MYDEFGNYIGPNLDMSEEDSGSDDSGSEMKGSDYAYEKAVSILHFKQLIQNLVRTLKTVHPRCKGKTSRVQQCHPGTSRINRWRSIKKRTTSNMANR